MKKIILYTLLFSGIMFMAGAYIYHQYQYKRFEEFFMSSRVYGSGKMIIDTTFTESNKKFGQNVKSFKYLFFLKNKKDNFFSREFYTTMSYDKNFKVTGSGGAGDDFFNEVSIFGIKNNIYIKFIPEKWIPNKEAAYYVIVEYEKNRIIEYYIETKEKIENKKYTIYFKSYPPKKILDVKNEHLKD